MRRRAGGWMLAAAALAGAASCARDANGDPAVAAAVAVSAPRDTTPDPLRAVAHAILPAGPYRVEAVPHPGTIRGRVVPDHMPVPHDVTLGAGDEAGVCGARVRDGSVVTDGRGLGNALVWVSDARAGAPLPATRRATLAVVRCQVVPRVLALGAGTTIDFQSHDDATHHTEFINVLDDSLVSHMLTVDRWAVVPSARIAADPGLVRVIGTAHAFTRGYVAVFDHPSFAVTDRHGRFTIRGLPPGRYTLRVWQERARGVVDSTVRVVAGRVAAVEMVVDIQQ
ncbi:MAG: carboxypeptidase regulatory-like domain-containing protein [Gemmatimonadota bacterium]|nr:carboxypeptidase regulatory-like domain-containing protein [Gemmatimonadota bacterium]